MSNPTNIIFPTIDLFLYDLKDGLGEDETIIENKCKVFCKKIFGDLAEKDKITFNEKYAQIEKHRHSEIDAIDLLETRFRKFDSPLDGYYYPRQFGDIYALLVDYSGKLDASGKSNDQPQDINHKIFEPLKAEIEKRISYTSNQTNQSNPDESGTIGQTWLAWGKLEENKTDTEIEDIAKELYTQVVSNYNWNRDFIGKGKLLGGTIFELWYQPEIINLTGKEFWDKFRSESHHILIWLFPENISASDMRKHVQTIYQDFIRLFHYRHKIVWAYYQSRFLKATLKKEFIEIQESINKARKLQEQLNTGKLNLTQLQATLTNTLISLSDYTIALNYLDDQIRTIATNLENYKYRLEKITSEHQGSNLSCLGEFNQSEIYAKKYLQQAKTDYANLLPGLTVIQNLSSTLQGIIQLEQTKSDRKLDNTIALVGIGLAISGLTATVATQYLPKPEHQYSTGYDFSVLLSPAFGLSLIVSAPFLLALIYRVSAPFLLALIYRFIRR
ncbi:hypothetical protein [Brunnivagina elsteri]|uniref:hypothetical protein n=1 Tax=Brunnivagina elsteri TaxID=1247191 RepID=UPI001B8096E1|nr:hypothetical protein [Calothrix elsteri]